MLTLVIGPFNLSSHCLARYGCLEGYPDGTFRGNQNASRFEMAAALSACLDRLSQGTATKDQLEALKAFQEEIATMLASLKGITDSLEARTDALETQQFSTTTKLQGEVIMAVQFGDFPNGFGLNSNSPEDTEVLPVPGTGPGTGEPPIEDFFFVPPLGSAIARVRLSFNTSFTGNDLLNTVLETGNGGQDFLTAVGLAGPANPFPVPPVIGTNERPPLVDLGAVDYAGVSRDVTLYRFGLHLYPAQKSDDHSGDEYLSQ